MGIITQKNANWVGSTIALILTLFIVWVLWKMNFIFFNFSNLLLFFILAGLAFFVVFLILRILTMFAIAMIFYVIPWIYGVYTNDTFGFSTRIPLEFTNLPELHPPDPTLLIHARDQSRFASITIFAGLGMYCQHPTLTDIEKQEMKAVDTLHGKIESVQRIKIGDIDAVKIVSQVELMKIKKVCIIKDLVEFVIICSAPVKQFAAFDPAFEECFRSWKWIPVK
jgi:hypothetical protein